MGRGGVGQDRAVKTKRIQLVWLFNMSQCEQEVRKAHGKIGVPCSRSVTGQHGNGPT